MSEPAPGGYDPIELRRRIAVCFSVGELRALAEALGVGGVRWDRGIDEAAREIVKQAERYAGLSSLVAKLREMRPLVEWGEPTPASPEGLLDPVDVSSPAQASAEGALPEGVLAGPPKLSATPGTLGAPEAVVAPAPPTLAPSLAPSFPAPARPPPGAWPGTVGAPVDDRPRGLDPRILVAVAGLMLAAAVVAYLAGRASSGAASASASATPSASASSPEEARRRDSLAGRVTIAFGRGFANLARVCELSPGAGDDEAVFARVFEKCGPTPLLKRNPASPSAPPSPPEPVDATDAIRAPDRGRNARGPRPDAPPPAPRGGCMSQCDAAHAACRSRCGPEPTESGAYDGYQRCMGRCLSDASHCRLSCR